MGDFTDTIRSVNGLVDAHLAATFEVCRCIPGDTRRHDRSLTAHQPFASAALAGDRQALEVGLRPSSDPCPCSAASGGPSRCRCTPLLTRQFFERSQSGDARSWSGGHVLIAQFLGEGRAGRLCAALCDLLAASGDPGMSCRAGQPSGLESVEAVWQVCDATAEGDLDQLVLDEVGLLPPPLLKKTSCPAAAASRSMDVIIGQQFLPASWPWRIRSPNCAEVSDARTIAGSPSRLRRRARTFRSGLVRRLDPEQQCSRFSALMFLLRLRPPSFPAGVRDLPPCARNGDEPKRFNPANLEPTPLHEDEGSGYFILPAHSYVQGVALEARVANITVIRLKSTCAVEDHCQQLRQRRARSSNAGVQQQLRC